MMTTHFCQCFCVCYDMFISVSGPLGISLTAKAELVYIYLLPNKRNKDGTWDKSGFKFDEI